MDVPTEGHYGASQFFDGMDELAIHEISQAPQHESIDFVKAQLARTQQDNELMRPINYNHYKTAGMSLNGRPLQLLPLENAKWREQKVPWMPTGPFGGDTGFTLVYIAGSAAICVAAGLAVS